MTAPPDTTKPDLAGLILRLKSATGADRELDGLIALFEGWTFAKMPGDRCPYWRKPGVSPYFMREISGPRGYTASLDAALALAERVLPDLNVSVTRHTDGRGSCEMWDWAANRFEQAREYNRAGGHPHFHLNIGGATPALALLIAILRALQARTEEGVKT